MVVTQSGMVSWGRSPRGICPRATTWSVGRRQPLRLASVPEQRSQGVGLERLQAVPLPLTGALYICVHVVLDWVSFVHPFGAFGITPWNPSTGLSFAVVLLIGPRAL